MDKVKNIVLVHGAFGDGSHWRKVIVPLTQLGYNVTAVQNPLTSLFDDVHRTSVVAAAQNGPTLLVGHSYGGAVITSAGREPNVVGLVYIAAFAPDEGESIADLFSHGGNKPPMEAFLPDKDGFMTIKREIFHQAFCGDLSENEALVLACTQKPIAGQCLGDRMGEPAWKTKPSWYQISNLDKTIAPDIQSWMAARIQPRRTLPLETSHASLLSNPDVIVEMIDEAAQYSFEVRKAV